MLNESDQYKLKDRSAWDEDTREWTIPLFIVNKKQDEIEMINKLCKRLDEVLVDVSTDQLTTNLTSAEIPGLQLTDHHDWYQSQLQKLINERRKIPKEERLKRFRNDSVDEVDTTDLENFTLRMRYKKIDDGKVNDELWSELRDPSEYVFGEIDARS